jgi:hypothetical protein
MCHYIKALKSFTTFSLFKGLWGSYWLELWKHYSHLPHFHVTWVSGVVIGLLFLWDLKRKSRLNQGLECNRWSWLINSRPKYISNTHTHTQTDPNSIC